MELYMTSRQERWDDGMTARRRAKRAERQLYKGTLKGIPHDGTTAQRDDGQTALGPTPGTSYVTLLE